MIEELFKLIIPFFDQFGYFILLFSAILEGIPLIGTFVPGATIAVFGGYLGRTNILNFSFVVFLLTLGAFIGDLFNYFIGRIYGYSLLKKYGKWFFLTEERLEKVRDRVRENTGKTIIIGRFTSITRSLAPFAAGASHIDFFKFLFYTLISTFLWAISHAAVGFVFGKWLERISKFLGLIFFLAILLGFAFVYLYRYINKRHHVFKKLHVYTLIGMIFSLFFFSLTLQGVIQSQWFYFIDQSLAAFLISIRNPELTKFMLFVTHFADSYYVLPIAAILIICLACMKKYYMAFLTLFALTLGETLAFTFKWLTKIVRPENSLVETFSSSFPSGHATIAVIFGIFLFLSFVHDFEKRKWKILFLILIFIGVSLISLSRIYLNAHWTTDVAAGISLGLFSATFSILFFRIVVFVKKWLY